MEDGNRSQHWASIDHYLSSTNPYSFLTAEMSMQLKRQRLSFDYKLPVLVHNTHADEQPGMTLSQASLQYLW